MSNEGRPKVPPPEETGNVLQFLWKHKNKILVGGAICAAGYAAYQHYFPAPPKLKEDEEEIRIATVNNMTSTHRDLLKPGQRSRMLLRIRKQFDIAIKQFLPTVRLKIATAVDVSSAIRQIKELRSIKNNHENNNGSSSGTMKNGQHIASMNEALLWEEVKVSSLTLLYLSAYMVSAVTVLLRVQLHILGKSIHVMKPDGSFSNGMKDGGGSMMSGNGAATDNSGGNVNGLNGNHNNSTTTIGTILPKPITISTNRNHSSHHSQFDPSPLNFDSYI